MKRICEPYLSFKDVMIFWNYWKNPKQRMDWCLRDVSPGTGSLGL
jgi:hypothetical protein